MGHNYIIAGSGVAAVTAAKEIRDNDEQAEIFIFSDEAYQPYNRMKLSKELYSDLYADKNHIKKDKWFDKFGITVVQNSRIEHVDTDNKTVTTSTGDTIAYAKLLICTGSKNRVLQTPGAELAGVFAVRQMQDAENLKAYVENKNKVVLIGGGVQNLELAGSLRKAGKEVVVVEVAKNLMGRQLDRHAAQVVAETMKEAGVDVITESCVDAILGETFVTGVSIAGNVVACDAVIYSVGITPNVDFLTDSAIAINRGIVVNEKMETSVPDVYAAGDVVELNGEVIGLWGSAQEQGKVAGHNMSATDAVHYHKVTPTTLFQAFGLGLFSIGNVDDTQADEVVSVDDDSYVKLFIKNQQIVGAISFEGVMKMMSYKNAVDGTDVVDTTSADVRTIMASL